MADSIRDLFPPNRLSLIFGPPRSGRSTLLQQIMWDWSQGQKVFGMESIPVPCCLVDTIRPLRAIRATLGRLDLDSTRIPHVALAEVTDAEDRTIGMALAKSVELLPSVQVIFLDGLQALFQGNIIHYRDVLNFTIEVSKECQRRQITILATLSTSKSLEGSDTPVLQRIMGSTAWLDTAGGLVHLAPEEGRELEADRIITRFPPDGKPIQDRYSFNESGRLEYKGEASLQPEMELWLQQIAPGSDIISQDIQEAATARGLGRSKAYEWLKQKLQLGQLVLLEKATRSKPGTYRKPNIEPS